MIFTVEIISRMDWNSNGLNIVTIKAYSYDMIGFMLIGRKKREKIRMSGKNGNKYIDIIKPVPAISVRTGNTIIRLGKTDRLPRRPSISIFMICSKF